MAIAAVHPAEPADIPRIDRIQREIWQVGYSSLLPAELLAELAAIDVNETEQAWTAARERLLVATEGDWTVGFCASGLAPEDDVADANGALPADAGTVALISTLLVEPRWGRRGHGGRLIASAAETLRTQGATRGITWILEGDTVTRAFYARIGWQPDGIARTLDAGGHPLREIRLTGDLDLTLKPPADEVTTE
jgi:GNAT superfamily N-acetyltransferase